MRRRWFSSVSGFAVRLTLLYALLAVPWPIVPDLYAAAYRGVANALFHSFGSDGVVSFRALAEKRGVMDTEIVVGRRQFKVTGSTTHSTRIKGYLPTAELAALILATPIAWLRRLRALALGMVCIHAFIAARLVITLIHWFSTEGPWALYDPIPFWRSVLDVAWDFGVVAPTLTFVFPALIWLAVTFRSSSSAVILGWESDRDAAA